MALNYLTKLFTVLFLSFSIIGPVSAGYEEAMDILNEVKQAYVKNGEYDIEKYHAMAKRSVTERKKESEAYDMMAEAADQGNVKAKRMIAAFLLDKVGPMNRVRLVHLAEDRSTFPPSLLALVDTVKELHGLGESYATLHLAADISPILVSSIGAQMGGEKTK